MQNVSTAQMVLLIVIHTIPKTFSFYVVFTFSLFNFFTQFLYNTVPQITLWLGTGCLLGFDLDEHKAILRDQNLFI